MTATLRARKPRSGQTRPSDKNYVQCPVCGVPTGTFENAGCTTRLYPTASGDDDGCRCNQHGRTLALRAEQTAAALAWIARENVRSQLVHE